MDGRNIYVTSFVKPVILRISASKGANAPAEAGDEVTITGHGFSQDNVFVKIGETQIKPGSKNIGSDRIKIALTDPSLRAGIHGVQVVRTMAMGGPSTIRNGPASNIISLKIRPKITVDAGSASQVTLKVEPRVGKNQRVNLFLDEISPAGEKKAPASHSFKAPFRKTDAESVTIPISNVTPGKYLARLGVDGAESLPGMVDGVYAEPHVDIA